MADFKFRTEDISLPDIPVLFVESRQDREAVEELKAISPTILIGSRGVGKSFLLRVAESELNASFESNNVLPIYVTFRKSSLIHTNVQSQFHHWMLGRVCAEILRALKKRGIVAPKTPAVSILGGTDSSDLDSLPIETVTTAFEESWRNPGQSVDTSSVPTIDDFKDAIEDLCESLELKRIALFFDEAAHALIPEQQRQFFTLFRDLRSPYITCNAAVYPGVTTYGDSFQPTHDARMLSLDRDVTSSDYVDTMREMVTKQADSSLSRAITQNGQNFAVMVFAASGNPRILLKTVAEASQLRSSEVNEIIRTFYRSDIWSEHSQLAEKYVGHRALIDWGRKFIEGEVLPELQRKNIQYLSQDKNSTAFFWVHRDAPQSVKEALRLLAYTGIVAIHDQGIKATRSEVGTRYSVNLGCLLALESTPASTGFAIGRGLTPKRMSEYGANHPTYSAISDFKEPEGTEDMIGALRSKLECDVDVLDITPWQKEKLRSLECNKVEDVLTSTEAKLKEANYVGDTRARQMRNAAFASVFEYLSG